MTEENKLKTEEKPAKTIYSMPAWKTATMEIAMMTLLLLNTGWGTWSLAQGRRIGWFSLATALVLGTTYVLRNLSWLRLLQVHQKGFSSLRESFDLIVAETQRLRQIAVRAVALEQVVRNGVSTDAAELRRNLKALRADIDLSKLD